MIWIEVSVYKGGWGSMYGYGQLIERVACMDRIRE